LTSALEHQDGIAAGFSGPPSSLFSSLSLYLKKWYYFRISYNKFPSVFQYCVVRYRVNVVRFRVIVVRRSVVVWWLTVVVCCCVIGMWCSVTYLLSLITYSFHKTQVFRVLEMASTSLSITSGLKPQYFVSCTTDALTMYVQFTR
jgi:hypothetical protein